MNNNQCRFNWSTSRDQFFRPSECFTPLPNIVYDDLMTTMTGNEFKVYLAIWRKSWGWNSETCTLSYDQLATAAAVSVSTAIRSIDELEGRGLVTVTRTSTKNAHTPNVYRLNPPPNITPSFEPEPATAMTAMTAMTAIEPIPPEPIPPEPIPPEPIPSAGLAGTHPTHNLPGGGMNAAAILNHLTSGYTPTPSPEPILNHTSSDGVNTKPEPIPPELIPSAAVTDTHPYQRRRNANYPIPAGATGAIRYGLVDHGLPVFTHEEFLKHLKPLPAPPPLTVRPTLRKPPTPTEKAGAV